MLNRMGSVKSFGIHKKNINCIYSFNIFYTPNTFDIQN